MLDWLNRTLAPDAPPAPDAGPPDASPDLTDDYPHEFDPARPAVRVPESPDAQLARVLESLETLIDALTPGTPGREGASDIPEVRRDALAVGNTTPAVIPGNRYRTSLLVHNDGSATVYDVPDGAFDTALGMPIPAGAEREFRHTWPVRLLCATGETSSVRVLEESS